jgi:hypothetical protein
MQRSAALAAALSLISSRCSEPDQITEYGAASATRRTTPRSGSARRTCYTVNPTSAVLQGSIGDAAQGAPHCGAAQCCS